MIIFFDRQNTPRQDFYQKSLKQFCIKKGLDWKEILIKKRESGKPYLEGIEGFFVSISHTMGLCAIAFADCEIGIDVQFMAEAKMPRQVAFNRAKQSFLARNDSATIIDYYKEFSRMEAVAKYLDIPIMVVVKNWQRADIAALIDSTWCKVSQNIAISICTDMVKSQVLDLIDWQTFDINA